MAGESVWWQLRLILMSRERGIQLITDDIQAAP